jgi:beta-phosphoglucomutase
MQKKNVVLFDFDGVLADSESFYSTIWETILGDIGLFFNEESLKGRNNTQFLAQFELDEIKKKQLLRKKKQAEKKFFENLKIEKKIIELVNTLSKKVRTAIVSNNSEVNIISFLKNNNCHDCFEIIVSEELNLEPKPSPEPYLYALKLLNVQKENCLIVEDSDIGLLAALNAGIESVFYDSNNRENSLQNILTKILV